MTPYQFNFPAILAKFPKYKPPLRKYEEIKIDPILTDIALRHSTGIPGLETIMNVRRKFGCLCPYRIPLDYIYGTWWRCRGCGAWVEKL